MGGLLTYIPCDGYGIYMPILRSADTLSCRLDVALRLSVVSERTVVFRKMSFRRRVSEESRKVSEDHLTL